MTPYDSKTTTSHDEIRRWAEARHALPSRVTGSRTDAGMIRLDFPGYTRPESLEPISWSEWFHAFESNDLAFLYQDETADGARSKFNKLVRRDAARHDTPRGPHAPQDGAARSHLQSGPQR